MRQSGIFAGRTRIAYPYACLQKTADKTMKITYTLRREES